MNIRQDLLERIAAYCAAHEISETTFGLRAVNDGKLVGRLRRGEGVTLATVEKVIKFTSAAAAA